MVNRRKIFWGMGGFALCSTIPYPIFKNLLVGPFEFLELEKVRVSENKFESVTEMKTNSIQITPGRILEILPNKKMEKEILEIFIREYNRRGIFDGKVGIEASQTKYVVPENKEVEESVRKYTENAIEFIKNSKELEKLITLPEFEIKAMNSQINPSDYLNSLFIGSHTYILYEFNSKDKKLRNFNIQVLERELASYGSFGFFANRDKDLYHAFIATNNIGSTLAGPFSELIPLSPEFRNSVWELNRRTSLDRTSTITETISESLTYTLLPKFLKEMGREDWKELTNLSYQNILDNKVGHYNYVPNGIRHMKKNGISSSFELYMNNPRRYFSEVIRT